MIAEDPASKLQNSLILREVCFTVELHLSLNVEEIRLSRICDLICDHAWELYLHCAKPPCVTDAEGSYLDADHSKSGTASPVNAAAFGGASAETVPANDFRSAVSPPQPTTAAAEPDFAGSLSFSLAF